MDDKTREEIERYTGAIASQFNETLKEIKASIEKVRDGFHAQDKAIDDLNHQLDIFNRSCNACREKVETRLGEGSDTFSHLEERTGVLSEVVRENRAATEKTITELRAWAEKTFRPKSETEENQKKFNNSILTLKNFVYLISLAAFIFSAVLVGSALSHFGKTLADLVARLPK